MKYYNFIFLNQNNMLCFFTCLFTKTYDNIMYYDNNYVMFFLCFLLPKKHNFVLTKKNIKMGGEQRKNNL